MNQLQYIILRSNRKELFIKMISILQHRTLLLAQFLVEK